MTVMDNYTPRDIVCKSCTLFLCPRSIALGPWALTACNLAFRITLKDPVIAYTSIQDKHNYSILNIKNEPKNFSCL